MTLESYLKANYAKQIIDHVIRAEVAALGYTGKELTIRVLAIAAIQSALLGNKEAEAHFTARAKEVAA